MTPPSVRVYLGLGSNIGDRAAHVTRAIALLDAGTGLSIRRASSIYETVPWGEEQQRAFLNAVLVAETDLAPGELLAATQSVEKTMGRQRTRKWGPRVIDIDILVYGDHIVEEAGLRVPHPLLRERQFMLVPLLEVAPELTLPGGGRVADLVDADASGIVRQTPPPWPRGSDGDRR
ncbi:MAG: 2-amino-4-hydroxy-6-hydroxymethyldihydropteridine diphosphokinase [Armatimonadota bacterium]